MTNLKPMTRLLITDDDFGIRTSISLMLRSRGYSVDQAASGRETIELLANVAYDLLLLDMRLPDLDGLDVLRQATALQPQMAIVVLSGHPSIEHVIGAARCGRAVDLLRKPASWKEIEQSIHLALERPGHT